MIQSAVGDVEPVTAQRHYHWLEKLQVQATAVAAAVAAYFLIWPLVAPIDREGPVTFVAVDPLRPLPSVGARSLVRAAILTAATALLAAACCLPTVTARPEGTMVAVLFGLGGLSLRSGPMRALLWVRQHDLGTMFWQMALEVLLLAAMALLAGGVVRVVRGALSGVAGRLAWHDLLRVLSEAQQREYIDAQTSADKDKGRARQGIVGGGFGRIIVEDLGILSARSQGRRGPTADAITRCGLCFLVSLAAAVALVWALARSAERGQLLFALVAGNFLATLVACQLFPTRLSWAAWASPVAAGVAFYVLAAVGAVSTGQGAWMNVEPCHRALPIDWMTAGLGGAMLGYWVSSRMHESRFLENYEEQEEGA